ncbi:hypothetical protein FOA52_010190 [Chlamydomonas sp. UWO 241]|nr:hypothetical protein FOA52_010190 [Chlamydomonas sp. UWO 241]
MPVNGWMQACSCCRQWTSHEVELPGEIVAMCQRCIVKKTRAQQQEHEGVRERDASTVASPDANLLLLLSKLSAGGSPQRAGPAGHWEQPVISIQQRRAAAFSSSNSSGSIQQRRAAAFSSSSGSSIQQQRSAAFSNGSSSASSSASSSVSSVLSAGSASSLDASPVNSSP